MQLASRPVIEASARGFIKIIRHLIDQYSVDINAQDKVCLLENAIL